MAASRRIILFLKRAISAAKKPLFPSAFNYDRRIGEIWVLDVGAYDGEPIGDKIGVADPSMAQGGYYDNRE